MKNKYPKPIISQASNGIFEFRPPTHVDVRSILVRLVHLAAAAFPTKKCADVAALASSKPPRQRLVATDQSKTERVTHGHHLPRRLGIAELATLLIVLDFLRFL
jgi:hypothetical protein